MRISDWSSDVCSSDLTMDGLAAQVEAGTAKPETIHRFLISAERDIDKLISLQNHPAAETLRRFAVEAGTGYNRPIMMIAEASLLDPVTDKEVALRISEGGWVDFSDRKSTRLNSSH